MLHIFTSYGEGGRAVYNPGRRNSSLFFRQQYRNQCDFTKESKPILQYYQKLYSITIRCIFYVSCLTRVDKIVRDLNIYWKDVLCLNVLVVKSLHRVSQYGNSKYV